MSRTLPSSSMIRLINTKPVEANCSGMLNEAWRSTIRRFWRHTPI